MKTLLVATDFSERSDRALRRAVLLAKQLPARLKLVHVVDDDQPEAIIAAEREVAEKLLVSLTRNLDKIEGVSSDSLVISAAPFSGILRAVDEFRPELLVLGPHRRQVLRDVFMGTTAERTIRSSSCPTLMANAMPAGNYHLGMLTTDLAQESLSMLACHNALVEAITDRCLLLHVYDLPASGSMQEVQLEQFRRDVRHQVEQKLDNFATALAKTTNTAPDDLQRLVREQQYSTADEILDGARETDADLLVVANRNLHTMERMFLGSVSSAVLKNATRDVLVLPVTVPQPNLPEH